MQITAQLLHVCLDLFPQRIVSLFCSEIKKFRQFSSPPGQVVPFLNLISQGRQPPRGFLRLYLVRPEVGLRQSFLQLADLFLLAS